MMATSADTLAPPPGQGTIADVSAPLPAIAPAAPTMQPPGMPAATLGEAFGAGVTMSDPYRTDFDRMVKFNGYKSILPALNLPDSENPVLYDAIEQGGSITAGTYAIPRTSGLGAQHGLGYVGEETQEDLIVNEIKARRAADPKFLPGVPDTVDGLHAWFLDQEKKSEGEAATTAARVRGVPGHVAAFAGGLGGTFTDPLNMEATVGTIPIGGEGGFLASMARGALINGALETATLPFAAHNLNEIGQHLTAREAVTDVATAAAGGALFDVGAHTVGKFVIDPLKSVVPEAVFKAMPESVQTRWASRMKVGDVPLSDLFADIDNHELAQFAKTSIGEERMTPEEKAAVNVVTRSQEIGDRSPFEPGPVGDAAHAQSLGFSIRAILDGPRAENVSAASDLLAHSALTPPSPRAPIFSPGLDVEFSAILGNEHGLGVRGQFLTSPAGAIGPAQVMPGTAPYAAKLAGVAWDPVKYRSDADYNRALGTAYYSELKRQFGGDPLKAAAAYDAGPGSAARGTGLRGAMERARIAGEPDRWVAYLPAETQKYVRDFERRIGAPEGSESASTGADAATGEDPAIVADQEAADQADNQATELAQQLGLEERRAAGIAKADPEVVPELRRDLFADEASWSEAQAATALPYIDPAMLQKINGGFAIDPDALRAPLDVETAAPGVGQPEEPVRAPAASGEPPAAVSSRVPERMVLHPAPRQTGTDIITFIRKAGGIRDDEGHDLRFGRGYVKRPGLINSRGHSIDAMGELLHEAGYFGHGAARPTEAEVLDLIERGFNEKTYAPHDVLAQGNRGPTINQVLDAVRDEATHQNLPLTADDEDLALEYIADGYSPGEAAFAAFEHRVIHGTADLLDEIGAEGVEGHDYEAAADSLRASVEGSQGGAQNGAGDENHVPGFDDARDRRLAGSADNHGSGQALDPSKLADVRIDDPALRKFENPNGDGQQAQVESLYHDLKLDVGPKPGATFRLSEDGKERPIEEIVAELQRGRAAIEALKGCLK